MSLPAAAASDPLAHALACLADGASLTVVEAREAFRAIMAGGVPEVQVGAFLMGLRTRGETAEEMAGAVLALREAMLAVSCADSEALIDTCGTGGGRVGTLNLSTAAAFVAAGAGARVAKHGNRSFTSRSGSADVLAALGVGIDRTPEESAAILAQVGMVFLFAPTHHPAMRHVAPVRRALGVPTIMNLIGPLANPAGVRRQVVGVADPDRAPRMAEALARLDTRHAWVAHGEVGMDEISPVGVTRIWEVRSGQVESWLLDPAAHGLATDSFEGLAGGEPEENAARLEALFRMPDRAAPALHHAVILNAAAALVVGGRAEDLAQGIALARTALHQGAALAQLDALRQASPAVRTAG